MSDKVKAESYWPRFLAVFGKPRDPARVEGLARELARLFRSVPVERIERIADAVIDEHEGAGWPRPATIRRTIQHYAPAPVQAYANRNDQPKISIDVERAMTSPQGRRALAGGFGKGFLEQLQERGVTFDEAYAFALEVHAENEATVARLKEGDSPFQGEALLGIWETRQQQEAALAAEWG